MDRLEKKSLVEELNQELSNAAAVIVTEYKGLSVDEMSELRANARQAGAKIKVAKNRLVKIALGGTEYEQIAETFKGQTAFSYGDDPVAAAKAVVKFAKDNEKLVILGGAFGSDKLDVNGVKNLASMPSLDELRAKIIAMVTTPAQRIATIAQAPAGQLARVMQAKADKGE